MEVTIYGEEATYVRNRGFYGGNVKDVLITEIRQLNPKASRDSISRGLKSIDEEERTKYWNDGYLLCKVHCKKTNKTVYFAFSGKVDNF